MNFKTSLMMLLVIVVGVLPCYASANTRLALVIGNSAYIKNALDNPRNDATDMATILRKADFKVTHLQDLDRRAMARGISEFTRELEISGAVGLFYYAGHGAEVNGINYLLPLNMEVKNSSELEFEAINVQRLLKQMEQARNGLNIVMIDACRNNPFRSFRGSNDSRGLRRMNAPLGSIISSSTASGDVAADGAHGRNSPYTQQLLAHLNTPGLSIEQVFKRVRIGVLENTNGTQIPWETSSLTTDFYFQPAAVPIQITPSPTIPIPAPAPIIFAGRIDADSLLQKCEAHLNANRLTSGVGGNALECYIEALEIRPGQPDALRGLTQIEDKYITWTKREIKRNNPTKASTYLKRLKIVNIEREEVSELEEAIAVLQAPQQQSAAAAKKPQPAVVEVQRQRASYEPEMVFFKGGSFQMGCVTGIECYSDETVHSVNVASFYMAKTEVTQAQWKAVMGNNPSKFKGDNRPVEKISWNDTQKYIKKLNNKTGKQYRLPTEAEWEYAARGGGNKTKYPWGNQLTHDRANYTTTETKPVGSFAGEGNGLHDTVGNVWELTASCYTDNYSGSESTPANGNDSCSRIIRGGSWSDTPGLVRSALRSGHDATGQSHNIGFRLSRTR